MHTPQESDDRDSGIFATPRTISGRLSIWLGGSFVVLFALWLLYIDRTAPMSRPTIFSDLVHAVLILSAAAAAVGGAISGGFALVTRHERSIMVVLSVFLGAFVLYWAIAETIGH